MQSLDNAQDVTVCRNCLGFAGDVISQLEVLSGIPRHECLERHKERYQTTKGDNEMAWRHNRYGQQLTGLYECLAGCGEVYCSSECRSDHFARGHRLLCVGPIPEEEAVDHPLVAFRIHAMQTNEIFLLVGEVMAQIATAFLSDHRPGASDAMTSQQIIAAARAPFADFVQEPWWDVAAPRTSSSEDEDGGEDEEESPMPRTSTGCGDVDDDPAAAVFSFADTLRRLCEESSSLLRSAFVISPDGGRGQPLPASLESALSADMFGRVVGMFEQNNVGIRAPSPIPSIIRELLSRPPPDGESAGCCGNEGATKNSSSNPCSQEFLEEVARLAADIVAGQGYEEDEEEEASSGCCAGKENWGGDGGGGEKGCCDTAVNANIAEETRPVDRGSSCEQDPLAVIRSVIDDGDANDGGLFAPLDGTALYSLICCMNHSCRPNCIVQYPGRRLGGRLCDSDCVGAADPLVAEVVLLRDVSVGEELTQSYVTREMGLVDRRNALKDYGFICSCPQCLEEEAAVAVSSRR